MKLLIILSVVAYNYADKLDRTYLPPTSAGSAGGSPGALIAPGPSGQGSFGKGPGPVSSGSGLPSYGGSLNINQGITSGPVKSAPNFRPTGSTQSSGPSSFGSPISGQGSVSGPQFGNGQHFENVGNTAFSQNNNNGIQNKPGLGQQSVFGTSESGPQGAGFESFKGNAPSLGSVSRPSFNQGFQPNAYVAPQPERSQAAADRSAEILKLVNENNGESYYYSYETSNGISAEESGIATNGVRAQGAYAYTGDDGNRYSVTYTADENGYQPQGEHLPTPHPIPEEILKSIEANAKAAAAGVQEGAYRPEEYESENSVQQYNKMSSTYNQPQSQGANSRQTTGFNQPQDISGSQKTGQGPFNGQSGFHGQAQSNQASNQFSSGQFGKGENKQSQQGYGNQNQGQTQGQVQYNQATNQLPFSQNDIKQQNGQSFGNQNQRQGLTGQNIGQNSLIGQGDGYQYSHPQSGLSSSTGGQRPLIKNHPQTNAQRQSAHSQGLSQIPGSISQDIGSSSSRPTEGLNNQNQGFINSAQSYQQPQSQGSVSSQQGQKSSVGFSQPAFSPIGVSNTVQQQFGSNRPSFGSGITQQGQQSFLGSKQPSFGSTPFGSQQQVSGSNSASDKGYQYGLNANQPIFSSGNEIKQGSRPFGNTPSNKNVGAQSSGFAPGAQTGPVSRPQYQHIGNQATFGSNNLNQGSELGANLPNSGSSRPQDFQPSQQYQPTQHSGVGTSSQNGRPNQAGSEFGGPRQPPSFSPQEGYKY